jgi:hypothetical protein
MLRKEKVSLMNNRICVKTPSGLVLSIVTGEYAYCEPRDDDGPHTAVEVGVLVGNDRVPQSWLPFRESEDSYVYPWLPVRLLAVVFREED